MRADCRSKEDRTHVGLSLGSALCGRREIAAVSTPFPEGFAIARSRAPGMLYCLRLRRYALIPDGRRPSLRRAAAAIILPLPLLDAASLRSPPGLLARVHRHADFLRSRRERLSPEALGLANGWRRRTPGLRRDVLCSTLSW